MNFANVSTVGNDFNMLSLLDLLNARDLYHLHLSHKENVIATAIGRYLIRKEDPWPDAATSKNEISGLHVPATVKPPRNLSNSEVRPYSWPCILVFVDQWVPIDEFNGIEGRHPDNVVPRALYLPDGRVVPVCVVEAPKRDVVAPTINADLIYPDTYIGGGYPLISDVQGQEHIASIGCLVTDGHITYALTNRHVSGEAGEPIYTIVDGTKVQIGHSSYRQLTRKSFQEVYASWPGKNVFVNLDIGLVEVEDLNRWTAQVYGIGQMGKIVDLSVDNISLRLIGCPVRAFGAVSRQMEGSVMGLFYRYKSVGGFDYTADFIIGSRAGKEMVTHPGDSGTLWLLDTEDEKRGLMPMAVQWGGHVFVGQDGKETLTYALATCLSTVCNLLEVDIIRDWNIGINDYWGAVGHYTIANKAVDAIGNPNLKKLMAANLEAITFAAEDITDKNLKGLSKNPFVPLADVPDLVWKLGHYNRGEAEHPNHFADMDKPGPDGKTLLDICKETPDNISIDVWEKYYTSVGDESKGLLPFRVWQFYQEMVEFVRQGDVLKFVTAAGILSHYVGDACQPLHISYMHDGDPAHTKEAEVYDRKSHQKVTKQVPLAAGVHSAYEDNMVNRHIAVIQAGVDKTIEPLPTRVESGHAAAVAVVGLMQQTFDTIQPKQINDAYLENVDSKPLQIANALWEKFGDDTIKVIMEGSRTLAMIWDSAWKQGGGDDTIKDLEKLDTDKVAEVYQDKSFLHSYTLDTIGEVLKDA